MQYFGLILLYCIIFEFSEINGQILEDTDRKGLVDAHNEVRSAVQPTAANMRKMEWSNCLAEVAYEYLKTCKGLQHNPNRQAQAVAKNCEASDQAVGENIYKTSGTLADITKVTTAWANEKSSFEYETLSCSGGVCGHYTQMIWFDSFLVGCAKYDLADCNGEGTIVLCNYAKGGNLFGAKPYESADQCSGCIAPWDNCNGGLCSRNDGNGLFPTKLSMLMAIYVVLYLFMF